MNPKYLSFRTDMADERVNNYKKVHNLTDIDGVEVISNTDNGVIITTVNILNENGKQALSKDIGKYVTIETQDVTYLDENESKHLSNLISTELKELIGNDTQKSILVVGLGNVYVTPDALGPKVVQKIDITRHLLNFAKDLVDTSTRSVSAISPGVLGTTGIETSEIVSSIISKVKPDMLIVIDSLASQSVSRVGKTIQISNTGITPGAGVKNQRTGLNKETLGIEVIAIGVPTVVDMATITNEAIDKMIESEKQKLNEFSNELNIEEKIKTLDLLEQDTRYDMIANVLDTQNYIVTPKEVDELIDVMAKIISGGINLSI